ncbi:ly6/PLAUR domain-containing protein 6-like [Apostichopus japonicus]|uniref:ly6/PLAUR domain-containing protein 6-like n=1 Tax=Stichopus japonicus TaxID=307972 RepID=UPI003AB35C83
MRLQIESGPTGRSVMVELVQRSLIFTIFLLHLAMVTVRGSLDPPPIFAYGDATPFPDAIKCYTCEEKTNNEECNKKAYDAFCPEGTKYCYTRHHMNHTSEESYQVTKKCAINDICSPRAVGCSVRIELGINHKVCTSCCEGTLCNLGVPTNLSTAIFTTITPYNHAAAQSGNNYLILLVLLSVAYVFRIL